MMKYTYIALLFLPFAGYAQFEIDKDINLNGTLPEDRQVQGLGAPVDDFSLMNASSLQMNSVNYATASGADDISVSLSPAPSAPVQGTSIYVFITANNTGVVTLTMNGNGPYPVKKNIDEDLSPSDLEAGMVARFLFDGSAFQLLNARNLSRRDCPTGFTAVNEQYCIEINERDTLTFFDAALICGDLGGRLCTWGEWNWACRDTLLPLNDMTGNWEWTGSTANGDHLVRVVGESSCTQAATSPDQPTPARNFRCCYSR